MRWPRELTTLILDVGVGCSRQPYHGGQILAVVRTGEWLIVDSCESIDDRHWETVVWRRRWPRLFARLPLFVRQLVG